MTNENKIIYLDRETMQGNVKKNFRALGIVYVLNMIFNVYHFGFCSIAISIFDISIEDREKSHTPLFFIHAALIIYSEVSSANNY